MHSNSFSFCCFHLWTHSWVHQGVWGCVTAMMLLVLLLDRCCYFYSPCLRLVFPPLVFAGVRRVVQIRILEAKFGRCDFFSSTFVYWWILKIIHVSWKCWLIMCLFVVCTNYLNIIHLIIHIASHLHNCIVYFFITLHLFFYGHKMLKRNLKKLLFFCV
jgi:hypothetical protein